MAVITASELVDATHYAFAGRKVSAEAHLAEATRLLPVAKAVCEKHGGDSLPEAILNEGIIRFSGYLLEGRFGAFVSNQTKIPPSSHAAAFQNSGAKMLVSPWKKRRAGRI